MKREEIRTGRKGVVICESEEVVPIAVQIFLKSFKIRV